MRVQGIQSNNYNCSRKEPGFKANVYCKLMSDVELNDSVIYNVKSKLLQEAFNAKKLLPENLLGVFSSPLARREEGKYVLDVVIVDKTTSLSEEFQPFINNPVSQKMIELINSVRQNVEAARARKTA